MTIAFVDPIFAGDLGKVRETFQIARVQGGDKIDKALAEIGSYLKATPDDPVAMVYQGSLWTMEGRDSFLPWNKLKGVNKGVEQMDAAFAKLANVPQENRPRAELEVRIVRGVTNANLPWMFNRKRVAYDDLNAASEHPFFDRTTLHDQTGVLAWLAVLNEREGMKEKAAGYLDRAMKLDPAYAQVIWAKK